MTQKSYFWTTAGGGDGVVVTQAHLMDSFFRAVLNGTGNRGVLKGWRDELLVSGTVSPLNVASGGAILYGMAYESDRAVSVTVPALDTTIGAAGRTDLIVVRRSWAAKTCRITRIAGPSAALVQTAGTTWDIPLASVTVDAAGTLAVTDTREFCTFSTSWAAGIVDSEHYAAGAVTPAVIADRTRSLFRGAGKIDTQSAAMYAMAWEGHGGAYGTPYDHWALMDGVTDGGWCYFMFPAGLAGSVDFYVWNAPEYNGLGAGAENVHWDLYVYQVLENSPSTLMATASSLVDQQARLETEVYADQIVTGASVIAGAPVAVLAMRSGAQPDDTYFAPIRFLGIEARYTADC